MQRQSPKGLLLAGTMLASTLLFTNLATAQEQPPPQTEQQPPPTQTQPAPVPQQQPPVAEEPAPEEEPEEEIVVTGSRIAQPNLESTSPITTVGAAQLQDRGITRVEDMLNQLPQITAAQSSGISNAGSGTAEVDLRNLGPERTLVLIDGRRLVPGDPFSSSTDLNAIPAPLIERIEVLTGGASAVYGADAVAGVVNFIMMDDFEGARIDYQYGFYQHNNEDDTIGDLAQRALDSPRFFRIPDDNVIDGESHDITAVIGVSTDDGRGNITAYAAYRNIQEILQADRGFSACSFTSGDTFTCAGSATTFPTFVQAIDQATLSPTGPALQVGPGGTLVPLTDQGLFNFGATNHFQRPDERYSLGAFAHYEFSPQLDVYTQLMFMDDRTVAQIAPSGLFIGSGLGANGGAFVVNCDNPFLSPDMVDAICTSQGLGPDEDARVLLGHRNVNGEPRENDLRHTMYRIVIGARGELNDVWSYDVYGQYGTVLFQNEFRNEYSLRRVSNALINEGGVCRINVDADLINDDPACVPLNVFDTDGPTPEMLDYVTAAGLMEGSTTQQVVSGALTGDLGQYNVRSPWADDGIQVVVGAEYRREQSEVRPDASFCPGTTPGTVSDLLGQGSTICPISGSYDVAEVFGEARVPIAQDRPFIHELGLELGYRYSDYSTGAATDTYKIGLEWAPTEDIRFRGGYNRAVRAPNIVELFTPQAVGLSGTTDPCAGAAPEATLEQCALTGVTPAQYGNIAENPASQYNALLGGNPDLTPETADTWTIGFVFTPNFVPDLVVSTDWYNIQIADRIGGLGADNILLTCLDTGDPFFCDRVHRAPGSGSLWIGPNGFIDNLNLNAGEIEASGVDIDARYRLGIGGAGDLEVGFTGSWLNEYVVSPLGAPAFDCAGVYGPVCSGSVGGFGNPLPQWRHTVRLTWETPLEGVAVGGAWRYIDEVSLEDSDGAPTDLTLDATGYFDLFGSWEVNDGVTVRAGVNNVLDEDPPLTGGDNCPTGPCNGNTWPGVYDALGRFFFVRVSAQLGGAGRREEDADSAR